jgi:hypothetical protein
VYLAVISFFPSYAIKFPSFIIPIGVFNNTLLPSSVNSIWAFFTLIFIWAMFEFGFASNS